MLIITEYCLDCVNVLFWSSASKNITHAISLSTCLSVVFPKLTLFLLASSSHEESVFQFFTFTSLTKIPNSNMNCCNVWLVGKEIKLLTSLVKNFVWWLSYKGCLFLFFNTGAFLLHVESSGANSKKLDPINKATHRVTKMVKPSAFEAEYRWC